MIYISCNEHEVTLCFSVVVQPELQAWETRDSTFPA